MHRLATFLVLACLAAPAAVRGQEAAEEPPPAESSDEGGFVQPPRLLIRGFGDVSFRAQNDLLSEERPSTFAVGAFDLFMTSALSERISVLGEIVFEFSEVDNAVVTDVERVQLKYAHSDLLNVVVGRMHTPLGYWNQTFHHGAWFQTTVDRPAIYRFEDEGGILPVHAVGVQLFGARATSAVDLEYSVLVGNGRGRIPDEVTNVRDINGPKAVNFLLSASPTGVRGLKIGVNAYFDQIPLDSEDTTGNTDERILGAFFVYAPDGSPAEALAEISHVRHDGPAGGGDTLGLYVQGAWRFGAWKPYYRLDRVDFEAGDPFFAGIDQDLTSHTVGLRWDAQAWLGLKAEYRRENRDGDSLSHAGALQAAFTF